MPSATWSFANSFLVFLAIVFLAQTVATRLRNLIPMPLLYGVLFAVGFGAGWLPKDLLVSANMVAVGTIAFNVLVIHSGTMIDLPMLKRRKKDVIVAVGAALAMTAVCLLVLPLVIGRDLALLAPGAVVGGGASCAIGSRWVSSIRPEISFYPWMIFMFQGIFSVPIVTWALGKERDRLIRKAGGTAPDAPSAPAGGPPKAFGPCGRIPNAYKTPAYYLGLIMIVAFLNNTLQGTLLKNAGINLNITALLLGLIVGNLGLVDRAPLFKCDSYGLLILSLMGLMANNLANTPTKTLLSLVLPVLAALLLGTAVLVACGVLFARLLHMSPYRGILLTANSIMGFPVNGVLVEQAVRKVPPELRDSLKAQLSPLLGLSTMLISNGLSVFLVSILVSFV